MNAVRRLTTLDLNRILPVLAIAMEVIWSYSWFIWVSSWPSFNWNGPPLNLVSYLALGIGVGILNRFSSSREWSVRRLRWVVVGGSLLLLIILVRWNLGGGYSVLDTGWISYAGKHIPEILLGFFFGTYIIWRGISCSRHNFDFSDLYRQFVIGLSAIILLLIVWGITGAQMRTIWSSAGSYVIAYFGLGLLGLAIVSLEKLRSELLHHKEAAGTFKRRWLSMMVVMVLAILGISAAASNILSSSGVQTFIHALSRLGNWLLIGLSYLLLPIGYLVEALIFIGRWLVSLLRNDAEMPKLEMPNLDDLRNAAEGRPVTHIPEALVMALKWIGLLVVISLVIFFLVRALSRYWNKKDEEGVEEIHETIWSWSLFKADLRSFFGWLFRWAHRRGKAESRDVLPPAAAVGNVDEEEKIFNIRELYRAVLWQGRQAGTPRDMSDTPYEYLRKWKNRPDLPEKEVDAITEAYVIDRYGLINPSEEKVRFLNRLWRTLRNKILNPEGER